MSPTMVEQRRKFCEIKPLKQPKRNSQSSEASFYVSTKTGLDWTGLKVQKFFWKQLRK